MVRYQFPKFAEAIRRLGPSGLEAKELQVSADSQYRLQYIPFEHVDRAARLVIVGITPGTTQLGLAYGAAQQLIEQGEPEQSILVEVKKIGAFGGPSMRPNLLRMLRHFRFEKLLGIEDVESLWSTNAKLLQATSVVPHAAFKRGKMFAGSFEEVLASKVLRECFEDCFVGSLEEISDEALYVGLGPCPQAALAWCVQQGHLAPTQVLGAFCHPSTSGGSKTNYYLRRVDRHQLTPGDPTLKQVEWLDRAYAGMAAATTALGAGPGQWVSSKTVSHKPATPVAQPAPPRVAARQTKESGEQSTALETILGEFAKAGYRLAKETKKLICFEAAGNKNVLYLVKTASRMNRIEVMVHPEHKPETLRQLAGVSAVCPDYRYHSNLTAFPKRVNRGQTETAYGRQLTLEGIAGLQRFLQGFAAVM